MPFQPYANYAIVPPWESFSFRVEPTTDLSMYVVVCYGVLFLFSVVLSGPGSDIIWTRSGFHPHWLSRHQNCMHHLRSLIVFLHQSQGFLCSVHTISDTSKLQLCPSIKSCKLWCQARSLLLPVHIAGKMLASELIWYFTSHPATFRFLSSLSSDTITLNPGNRKMDQRLCDF